MSNFEEFDFEQLEAEIPSVQEVMTDEYCGILNLRTLIDEVRSHNSCFKVFADKIREQGFEEIKFRRSK